jgi:ABC-type antimicrobial peptide transport system permease subunit
MRVLLEGAAIGIAGIVNGAIGGVLLSRIVGSFVPDVQMPGLAPIAGAAFVLVVAAIIASVTPAARASRVDVVCALRAE